MLFSFTEDQYLESLKLTSMGIDDYLRYALNSENVAAHDISFLLTSGKYFCSELFSESLYPDSEVIPFLFERGLNNIILQVTRDCNFSCRYCQYASNGGISRKHENKHMNFDIAKQTIDFFMEHSTDAYRVNIGFYGGEPLLNIKLIKKIFEYIDKTYPFKLVTYHTTINASLLNDFIIKLLSKYKVNIMLSFDGPESVKNYNRKYRDSGKGSFQSVWHNIDKLKNNYKKYFIDCVTFHAVSLNDEQKKLAELFFEENSIPRSKYKIVFADLSGIDYKSHHFYSDFTYEAIHNKSIENIDTEPYDNMLKCFNIKYKIPPMCQHSGPCIPGISRLFVDTEGKLYICEKAVENNGLYIGSVQKGIDISLAYKLLNIGKLTQSECKSCYAFRFCSICAAGCIDSAKKCITAEKKIIECKNQRKMTLDFLYAYVESMERRK